MDFFDILIIGFGFTTLFFQRFTPTTQKILLSTFLITIITQLIFVGLRWQYYLIYILFFLRSLITLFDYKSSKKYVRFLISFKTFTLTLATTVLLYVFPVPSFESQAGALYSVGYSEELITIESRLNPVEFIEISNLQEQTQRELLVDVYYPSNEDSSFNQILRSADGNWGTYIVRYLNRTWELSLPEFLLQHLKFSKFEVQEGLSPIPNQQFPVLIYSHGWAGEKIFASDQLIHLASQGYVIFSIDHTGLAMFTDLPSGIIFNTGSTENSSNIHSVMFEMKNDIEDSMNYFQNLSSDTNTVTKIVREAADFNDISVMAHSTGAGAVVEYCLVNACQNMILQDPFLTPFIDAGEDLVIRNKTDVIYSEDWFSGYTDSDELTEIEVYNTILSPQDVEIHGYYMKDSRHYDFVAFGSISPLTKYTFLKGSINYEESLDVNNYFNRTVLNGGTPNEDYSPYLISIDQ